MIGTIDGSTHEEDGCVLAAVGEYSPGGTTCTASPMKCAKGKYAAKVGSVDDQDGCNSCGYGYWSSGGNNLKCKFMQCNIIQTPTKLNAINSTDGCEYVYNFGYLVIGIMTLIVLGLM
jgi:hypothetical protein